jgi:6-pyruvoyltetrahydropterin/6-carboxytetrahydropterin synthase
MSARLSRVYRFSSSHRLHSPLLNDEENRELYGKCNNPHGHGHDYVLHVAVAGEVDEKTGRVASIGALDRYVNEKVIRVFDHRDMNADVEDFEGVPTTENLAVDVERRLQSDWKKRFGTTVALDRILIRETPRNTFELESTGKR